MEVIRSTRGDSLTIKATFTDKDGDPVDLDGCTVKFQLRVNPKDEDVVLEREEVVDGSTTEYSLELTPSETIDLLGLYHYDIEVTEPEGNVYSTPVGGIKFLRDITRLPDQSV